jgi:hypothetical protein
MHPVNGLLMLQQVPFSCPDNTKSGAPETPRSTQACRNTPTTCAPRGQRHGAQLELHASPAVLDLRRGPGVAPRPILHQKLLALLQVFREERTFHVAAYRVTDIDVDAMVGFVQDSVGFWLEGDFERDFRGSRWKTARATDFARDSDELDGLEEGACYLIYATRLEYFD